MSSEYFEPELDDSAVGIGKKAVSETTKVATAISPTSMSESTKIINSASVVVNALHAKQWNPTNPDSWDSDMREYHAVANSDYVLPSDHIEQNRLEMQHYIFRAAFGGDIICPSAKYLAGVAGAKILDVGCANGVWLQCIKKANPLADCHGVDIAETLISEASVNNENSTFDYVHQRLLVLGMPRDKFVGVLEELIRVTKPGGWIELVEANMVYYSPGPYTKILGTSIFDAINKRGLDCYAATNLPWYVAQVKNNVETQDMKTLQMPVCWGSEIGKLNGTNLKTVILAAEDWMHTAMGVSREDYRQLVQNCYDEWAENKTFYQARALYFQVKK
ncbi:hypothetical protein HK100_004696 [Physocladia obscura]|uniref:Methyltransferase domain-containing protein n=1 Tax=Physocladia obscura TaxID=109957 RepID=A0AAD5XCU0_9FUNG|nr:hypothetical protein HK100_004696 [Physocladia obscura]